MITKEELHRIMPYAKDSVDKFAPSLNAAMYEYEIFGPLRIAAFVAQIAHESGELRYVRELADGSAYEGRKGLGNTEPGDGPKFRGRGLLQVTGRSNYAACSLALFSDNRLLDNPELLEKPEHAAMSAGWFWDKHRLNQLADQEDLRGITKKINGGYNGMDKRLKYYNLAKDVLGGE